jgi:GDPmannose 4,6-dehydratase
MNYKDYVKLNPKYLRSEELNLLRGDGTEVSHKLGWKPTYSFESMIDEMLEYWNSVI